jgi:hypothetical protein
MLAARLSMLAARIYATILAASKILAARIY